MNEDFQERVVIYALLDPRTYQPFYVGSTRMKLQLRLQGHIDESLSETMPNTPKCKRVKELLDADLRPLIEPLEECEGEYRARRERHWHHILEEDGAKLTNKATIAGNSRRRRKETEKVDLAALIFLSYVMTIPEAEFLYELQPGIVITAIQNGEVNHRVAGSEILILTVEAEQRWNNATLTMTDEEKSEHLLHLYQDPRFSRKLEEKP